MAMISSAPVSTAGMNCFVDDAIMYVIMVDWHVSFELRKDSSKLARSRQRGRT